MRRDWATPAAVGVVLALGASFALLTRHPEAEIVARAEGWPWIGPAARAFRSRYLPPPPRAADPASPESPSNRARPNPGGPVAQEPPYVAVMDPDLVGRRRRVWVPANDPIYKDKDLEAPVVARSEHSLPLEVLERRGDWYRVRFGARMSGERQGWVFLEDYREPTAEELARPDPVLPLEAVRISPEILRSARGAMGSALLDTDCGPYRLVTDAPEGGRVATCRRLVADSERVFAARYRLQPVSPPRETILVFPTASAYRLFRDAVAPSADQDAHAFPARGYVALAAEGAVDSYSHALTHELAHLWSRRAIGPALPAWLGEGVAEDLARVLAPETGAGPWPEGGGPPLRRLMALDEPAFRRGGHRNYDAVAGWLAYFLEGPESELATGFRGFLAEIASGEPITEELLLRSLGRGWPALEEGFVAWRSRLDARGAAGG